MIPILYAADDKSRTGFGLGLLAECTACSVTEERNGSYELSLKYPPSGKRAKDLREGCVLRARVSRDSEQLFRICGIRQEIEGPFTCRARHISYDLNGCPLYSYTPAAPVTADEALKAAFAASDGIVSHGFTAYSDIDGTRSLSVTAPCSLRAFCGTAADTFGGDLEWDGTTVRLLASRGRDTGFTVRYGGNMTSFVRETDESTQYTHILPYAVLADGTVLTLSGVWRMLPLENTNLSRVRVKTVDLSSSFSDGDVMTEDALREAALAYIAENGSDLTRNGESLSVSCVPPDEDIRVCDTVRVEHGPLGVSVSARVVRTEYDVLRERLTSMKIGDTVASLTDTVANFAKGKV